MNNKDLARVSKIKTTIPPLNPRRESRFFCACKARGDFYFLTKESGF